ncbi:50S ribosomal protein L21 [Riemerella anatipestifer]|uniref:Large ribosomal subunit protein bL21 n=1 Tax=Riemerella anatipestifer TaxID=34085 RepID=A0A1S7DSD9_RIEAN|nr:50S ribosomal protein L21 [Riemerella anatipestifer]AQY21995.1 50S ribosomal protein L21 [Riemerella anatipestifer]MCO4303961.1 50S ribosomal protein L21 [Riemerella anatipestifer]MCO7352545.1 50S ribosomal protein L21 [Riemerella anatipestifer]MCQ4039271.1 50S ribosomal protein L21 [Riemerella anatipestifer]MCT6760931.1 50S ribosomal protein L21 [Riemerella anatipestifer]
MFAIVEIAGLQYKVEQDQKLFVNRLSGEKGDKVTFDKVLLTVNGATVVGAPAVSGIAVEAEIIEHLKADKVIVFKKKRRKGYAKKNGHRQSLTQIKIVSITGFDGAKKSSAKTETKAATKKSSKKGDDLTLIEGIGPKVAELFAGAGITSFADLAKKTKEELEAILDPNGAVYAAMDPTTWPQQAQLAADGKFEELETLKGQLKGGKA